MKLVKDTNNKKDLKKSQTKMLKKQFKTILTWMGEDPNREGID